LSGKVAVYAGTFDPVTNGHLDILSRAQALFDKIYVGVAADNYKENVFTLDERVQLLKEATQDFEKVKVEAFSGLLIDYVKKKEAKILIRGLRAVSDFEYEFQLAMMNRKLASEVDTVFLMTSLEYAFLSSSMVKQVASLGGCVQGLVPPLVEEELKKKYNYLK